MLTAASALLACTGCGLLSGDTWEGTPIPPASAEPTADLGLGPGVRLLSFGPGDKGSPRVNPSGDRVAFVLDGYVTEKPLHTQGFLRRTAKDFGAKDTEWLLDGSLAVLSPEDETEDSLAKTTPAPSSLFGVRPDDSSSGDSSDVRKLTEHVEAVGAVPGSQAVVVAVETSPASESSDESSRSRLELLWGSEESAKVYLGGRIQGYVTGLSVSPDGRQAVLAVRRRDANDKGRMKDRFEVQVYRFSESLSRRIGRVPKGMEILGAPQWTSQGVYFVAGEANDPDKAARDGDPAPHALYRVPEGSEAPEPVRSVGENFVAASISVSPDGDRLAVVGRRNPRSPTNLYVLNLASDTLEAATTNENMEIKTNPRDLAWSPDGRSVILVARGVPSGPEVYDAPAETLSSAFYNLYEVPVGSSSGGSSEG